MKKIGIAAAAVFSLALAGQAIAAGDGFGMRRLNHEYNGRVMQRMPAQGFGVGSPAWYQEWPGPYDDGNYRSNHNDYRRLPPSAHGG